MATLPKNIKQSNCPSQLQTSHNQLHQVHLRNLPRGTLLISPVHRSPLNSVKMTPKNRTVTIISPLALAEALELLQEDSPIPTNLFVPPFRAGAGKPPLTITTIIHRSASPAPSLEPTVTLSCRLQRKTVLKTRVSPWVSRVWSARNSLTKDKGSTIGSTAFRSSNQSRSAKWDLTTRSAQILVWFRTRGMTRTRRRRTRTERRKTPLLSSPPSYSQTGVHSFPTLSKRSTTSATLSCPHLRR